MNALLLQLSPKMEYRIHVYLTELEKLINIWRPGETKINQLTPCISLLVYTTLLILGLEVRQHLLMFLRVP